MGPSFLLKQTADEMIWFFNLLLLVWLFLAPYLLRNITKEQKQFEMTTSFHFDRWTHIDVTRMPESNPRQTVVQARGCPQSLHRQHQGHRQWYVKNSPARDLSKRITFWRLPLNSSSDKLCPLFSLNCFVKTLLTPFLYSAFYYCCLCICLYYKGGLPLMVLDIGNIMIKDARDLSQNWESHRDPQHPGKTAPLLPWPISKCCLSHSQRDQYLEGDHVRIYYSLLFFLIGNPAD